MSFVKFQRASLIVFAVLMIACATKSQEANGDQASDNDQSVWQEMDDFHVIMADTFHPYKDSSNLEPVRVRASELMLAANKWAAAPLPSRMDNDRVRAKLRQLKAEASSLAENVKSDDDNLIAGQLTKLHDTFHEIQEAWYEGK